LSEHLVSVVLKTGLELPIPFTASFWLNGDSTQPRSKGLSNMLRTRLLLIALLLSAASSAQAQVTIPNTFSDGTPALASEVNANFQALASAVNAVDCATAADVVCNSSCPAVPACDTLGSYNQGFLAGGNGVDITSDNAAVCATAGGTYDAGEDSCSVDITTDNAAAEALAAAAAGSATCTQVGGTWDEGTSTCAPASFPYNCFTGGFCSTAAPHDAQLWDALGWTNLYAGHTQNSDPELGEVRCASLVEESRWTDGRDLYLLGLLTIPSILPILNSSVGLCQ
jgi:hypothetical protein